MDERRDIILIVLDTQRANRLSCYGYSNITTPCLDEFVKRSTLFSRAIAPAQWTIPTHASIFTGLVPSQHTMLQMDSVLPLEIPTLAQRLEMEGFRTIGVSNNPLIGTMGNGLERGFSWMKNYNFWGAGLLNFKLNRHQKDLQPKNAVKEILRFIAAESLGYSAQTPINRAKSFVSYLWEAFLASKNKTKFDVTKQSLADAAELFLDKQESDSKPTFMFINLMGTHVPYAPPRWAVNKFSSRNNTQKQYFDMRRRANEVQVDVDNWINCSSLSETDIETLNVFYDAEVFTQDLLLGEFFSLLQSRGKLDEAFVVIVGDHGDHLGEKQRVNHAFGVHEELVHVPLIIRDPRGILKQGGANNSVVSTTRLFNTILEVAGVATSDEMKASLRQSEELKQADKGEKDGCVFVQGYPLEWALNRLDKRYERQELPNFAVYEDNLKLISAGDQAHLYQLNVDPEESNDLSAKIPETVTRLKKSLNHFLLENVPVAQNKTLDYEDSMIVDHLRALGYLE